ncbi:MAG: 50S ribosomal protein L19 [Candidatus Paceibacterota bacterium]|jgi:large subunit ribosomal protein L19
MKTNIKLSKVDMEERKSLNFASGDTVRVWNKLKDKDGKIRLQAFEGLVLARKHGTDISATFTVRKVASGVGVEKIYPLYSSNIDKIEIVRHAKTKRSKLYYVREKAVRDVRRKLKADTKFVKKDGVTTAELKDEVLEEGTE